jgi:hypothetical protein
MKLEREYMQQNESAESVCQRRRENRQDSVDSGTSLTRVCTVHFVL